MCDSRSFGKTRLLSSFPVNNTLTLLESISRVHAFCDSTPLSIRPLLLQHVDHHTYLTRGGSSAECPFKVLHERKENFASSLVNEFF